jgi:hypothetical protein
MRRLVLLTLLFSVICGLLAAPSATALTSIKLCGSANGLADSLIISGTFDPSGPFVMDTDWVQFVPTVYTLLGGGAVIRTIGDPDTFSGGLMVTNNSDLFANNPTCAVTPILEIVQSNPLMVSGSAALRCVGGPGSPFTVTIAFTLVSCNDPGPFAQSSGLSAEAAAVGAFEGSPGWQSRLPAGAAPNEYRE